MPRDVQEYSSPVTVVETFPRSSHALIRGLGLQKGSVARGTFLQECQLSGLTCPVVNKNHIGHIPSVLESIGGKRCGNLLSSILTLAGVFTVSSNDPSTQSPALTAPHTITQSLLHYSCEWELQISIPSYNIFNICILKPLIHSYWSFIAFIDEYKAFPIRKNK